MEDIDLHDCFLQELDAERALEAELSCQHTQHIDAYVPGLPLLQKGPRQGSAALFNLRRRTGPVLTDIPLAENCDDLDLEDAADEHYEPDEPYVDLGHVPSEWEQRSRKQYDETRNNRPFYFGLGILRAALPEAGTRCELCNDREACLRCLDCISQGPLLLCGLCDISQHPYAHFHRRESFAGGFWQREAPSVTFSEVGAPYERGEKCSNLLAVITSLMCVPADDVPVACRPLYKNHTVFLSAKVCSSRCVL